MNEQKARELFEDVRKLHSPDRPTVTSELAQSELQAQSADYTELSLFPETSEKGLAGGVGSGVWFASGEAPEMLIGCEHSGQVREAMRAKGINAWSCDLLPADDGSPYHIQGDVREAMRSRRWGAYGLHPDCTYLTVAGIHWNNRGRGWERTHAALAFVRELMALAGDVPWYLENPVSIISTQIRKPTQTIQPYDFGDDASKRTCLWLNRLPLLIPGKRLPGRMVRDPRNGKTVERWSNQTDSGQNKLAPSDNRWKLRSKTYPGIAAAMAEQWSKYLLTCASACA